MVPYVPRLKEDGRRGRYITPVDAERLRQHLPAHLCDVFVFAYDHGTRKGQLVRTLRRYVDLERGVISWPPTECKHKEAHTVPLEGDGLALVERLMTRPPLHCPYLFHGPHCAAGAKVSKEYGCVGDFKRAWATACRKAGLAAGRKGGGYTFHHTRNTAATNLRAGGMDEGDAMKVTGHQTAHVFRHYDLGDVAALRARLSAARARCNRGTAPWHRWQPLTRSAVGQFLHSSCTAGDCTARAIRNNACRSYAEPLAQSVEQLPFKQRVPGSIPGRLMRKSRALAVHPVPHKAGLAERSPAAYTPKHLAKKMLGSRSALPVSGSR